MFSSVSLSPSPPPSPSLSVMSGENCINTINDIGDSQVLQTEPEAPIWESLSQAMAVSEASRQIVRWAYVHAPDEDRVVAGRRLPECLAAQTDDPQSLAARELDLSGFNLTQLPECLNRLPCLESLSLYSNRLTDVPLSILGLKKLTHLNLSSNRLSEVPP